MEHIFQDICFCFCPGVVFRVWVKHLSAWDAPGSGARPSAHSKPGCKKTVWLKVKCRRTTGIYMFEESMCRNRMWPFCLGPGGATGMADCHSNVNGAVARGGPLHIAHPAH